MAFYGTQGLLQLGLTAAAIDGLTAPAPRLCRSPVPRPATALFAETRFTSFWTPAEGIVINPSISSGTRVALSTGIIESCQSTISLSLTPRSTSVFASSSTTSFRVPSANLSITHNSGGAPALALNEAFHYTSSQWAESIGRTGLRPGTYATPAGDLSGLQAQLELSLNPTRAAPNMRIRIDLAAMREAGYDIPAVTRVSNVVVDPLTGRLYTMPGGGYELQFPYGVPPKYLTVPGQP